MERILRMKKMTKITTQKKTWVLI